MGFSWGFGGSVPIGTESGFAVIVADHDDTDAVLNLAVDQRIGKNLEHESSAPPFDRRAQRRMPSGESGNPFKLVQKALCDSDTRALAVEVG